MDSEEREEIVESAMEVLEPCAAREDDAFCFPEQDIWFLSDDDYRRMCLDGGIEDYDEDDFRWVFKFRFVVPATREGLRGWLCFGSPAL